MNIQSDEETDTTLNHPCPVSHVYDARGVMNTQKVFKNYVYENWGGWS